MSQPFDALLVVSFGAPEHPNDVLPFLQRVVAGKDVPQERLAEVAKRYHRFGGVSPLGGQIRALLAELVAELNRHGPPLAVYWGNRNWYPLLEDTVRQMAEQGVRRALALATSAFGSYPGCRQYRDDIQRACQAVGDGAPHIEKLRLFYNHPGYIAAVADRVERALAELPAQARQSAQIVYTAHSIPESLAIRSPYRQQLMEACRLVSERLERSDWQLVYQSRSGRPTQPWLGPDIGEYLRQVAQQGTPALVVAPIGFFCEHMETAYDLDVEAAELCDRLGLTMVRAATPGSHPQIIRMIRQLVLERTEPQAERLALGNLGPSPDVCPDDCCPGTDERP